MKPWNLDMEQGEFLVMKYSTAENRPFSCIVTWLDGKRMRFERRTWNGCGWEIV
jgi:hypothetical protein